MRKDMETMNRLVKEQASSLRTSFGRDHVVQNTYKLEIGNDEQLSVIVKLKPNNLLLTAEQFIFIRYYFPRGRLYCGKDGIYKVNFSMRNAPDRDLPLETIFLGELRPKKKTNDFRKFGINYEEGFSSWDLYYGGTSLALISGCIQDDKNQTLGQLAVRVAYYKQIDPHEALSKLRLLRRNKMLGYYEYSLGGFIWTSWEPKKKNGGKVYAS